ncbi:hypothetical protein GQ457_08G036010 [Hibiscus cannabinus]
MEPRKEQEIQRRSEVSLFVENIPRRMHWKGLWHLFARHGDVTATFIAGKLSRGGKRFGFVRFGSEVEAMRAMERLNGCMIYGFLLTVKLAIQKVRTGGPQKQQISDSGLNAQKVGTVWKSGGKEEVLDGSARKKKIPGHVEDEELWKMKRCLIGEMATVCSVSSIASRLQEWGLNDIKVQRMGGKIFLLSFEDDELYTMLEDLDWSYLKEIFCKVVHWSESLKRPDRATWLEISGLPLHCWNVVTLKRLVETWGKVEALGENANHVLDCEKVTILITTSHANRIEELIDVEIGNLVHEVHVCEIGFKDEKYDPLCVKGKAKVQEKCVSTSSDCSMEASSEQVPCLHSENTGGSVGVEKDALKDMEKEAIKAMNVGKDYGFNCVEYSETSFRSLGEKEILGNSTSPYLLRSFGNQEEVFGEDKSKKEPSLVGVNDVGSKVLSWADIVSVGINDKQVHVGRELGTTKILDDAAELGTTPSLGFEEPINITCRVRWADVVNEITKTQGPATEEARMGMSCDITNKEERLSGWESGGTFFPELETLDCSRKTKSKKRYGSLLEFQDRVLSRVEKSRRDRNLRRNKISKSELEHSDLSGRSISDSDLHAKWVLATKEAKESLKLGKKLGMKVQGNESEVVRELTLIETT